MSLREFPELDGLHVFIANASSKSAMAAINEFLNNGCKVTAWAVEEEELPELPTSPNLHAIQTEIADEASSQTAFASARSRFGPMNILVIPNAPIADESHTYPIWETPLHQWALTYRISVQDPLATIKHFLRSTKTDQQKSESDIPNLAIVIAGTDLNKVTDFNSLKYMSGTPGVLHGLVQAVSRDLEYLNSKARINVLAHVSKPNDVGRAIAHLASHKAAGHISGAYLSIRMPDRDSEHESETTKVNNIQVIDIARPPSKSVKEKEQNTTIVSGLEDAMEGMKLREDNTNQRKHHVRIALSVDFDAISAHLGTGKHKDNNMADYSQGIFAGKVGALRLLRLFKELGIADKMTWFIPGHSMETFPAEVKQIVESGCEVALHGYSHEGAYQMTADQESDVLVKCIDLATRLTGKKPTGYRAPLYQIRETTIPLLEKYGFGYDSSLTHHDSQPYRLPLTQPIQPPDFSPDTPASTWMHPTPLPSSLVTPSTSTSTDSFPTSSLVEIPCNWYGEDETPLSYLPHVANSHGYVDVRVIEQMWKDRFDWLWEHAHEDIGGEGMAEFVFPIVLHPDTSGMAHVIGMVERLLRWLKGKEGDGVVFCRYEDIAREARGKYYGKGEGEGEGEGKER